MPLFNVEKPHKPAQHLTDTHPSLRGPSTGPVLPVAAEVHSYTTEHADLFEGPIDLVQMQRFWAKVLDLATAEGLFYTGGAVLETEGDDDEPESNLGG